MVMMTTSLVTSYYYTSSLSALDHLLSYPVALRVILFALNLQTNMPRGRKRDPTSSPSRALLQQREYRARRAQYVSSLENRCQMIEEENSQLRQEIADLQLQTGSSGVVANRDPQIVGQPLFLVSGSSNGFLNRLQPLLNSLISSKRLRPRCLAFSSCRSHIASFSCK